MTAVTTKELQAQLSALEAETRLRVLELSQGAGCDVTLETRAWRGQNGELFFSSKASATLSVEHDDQ